MVEGRAKIWNFEAAAIDQYIQTEKAAGRPLTIPGTQILFTEESLEDNSLLQQVLEQINNQ